MKLFHGFGTRNGEHERNIKLQALQFVEDTINLIIHLTIERSESKRS